MCALFHIQEDSPTQLPRDRPGTLTPVAEIVQHSDIGTQTDNPQDSANLDTDLELVLLHHLESAEVIAMKRKPCQHKPKTNVMLL